MHSIVGSIASALHRRHIPEIQARAEALDFFHLPSTNRSAGGIGNGGISVRGRAGAAPAVHSIVGSIASALHCRHIPEIQARAEALYFFHLSSTDRSGKH